MNLGQEESRGSVKRERERGLAFETGMRLLIILFFFLFGGSGSISPAGPCLTLLPLGNVWKDTLAHKTSLTFLHDPNHERGKD